MAILINSGSLFTHEPIPYSINCFHGVPVDAITGVDWDNDSITTFPKFSVCEGKIVT